MTVEELRYLRLRLGRSHGEAACMLQADLYVRDTATNRCAAAPQSCSWSGDACCSLMVTTDRADWLQCHAINVALRSV